jgi:hypothetical protein
MVYFDEVLHVKIGTFLHLTPATEGNEVDCTGEGELPFGMFTLL